MCILAGLTCIFILMKITHIIDWNWWIVLTPAIVELVIWGFIGYWINKFINWMLKD